jgi:transcriptional regulator with XRE-family HTH domain
MKNKSKNPLVNIMKKKGASLYFDSSKGKIRLADLIYKRRKEINLTQKDLAKQALTTPRVISNIETADINPGFDLIFRLVKTLFINSDSLGKVFDAPVVVFFPEEVAKGSHNTSNELFVYSGETNTATIPLANLHKIF